MKVCSAEIESSAVLHQEILMMEPTQHRSGIHGEMPDQCRVGSITTEFRVAAHA